MKQIPAALLSLFVTKYPDGNISATNGATAVLLVSKQSNFLGLWDFWILDFRISVFLDPAAISQKAKVPRSFQIFKKNWFLDFGFLYFWILGSSRHISKTKRATGDLMGANLSEFQELLKFSNKLGMSRRREELLEIRCWQKIMDFESFTGWQLYLCERQNQDLQLEVGLRRGP